jgi:hypothetical protein
VVWDQIRALLEASERVAEEYLRRLHAAQNTAAEPDEVAGSTRG